jgi:MAF protein
VRLVLASASPRRSELLRAAGFAFEVRASDVAEDLPPGVAPEQAAVLLAERKARAVAAALAGTDAVVLGADTIVALEEAGVCHLLGKPADADEARAMLARLSGSRHAVVTGVAAVRARDGAATSAWERTFVTMRAILEAEIAAYVDSREWEGKAGGYAIQETADRFVTRLEDGGFDNVVGLPVALVRDLLDRLRAAPPP